jgi:methyl-accepting chemotaxis protein
MALTISTVKVNARTARLLEQSQKQAEELANQEKEMRQHVQDLKYTQEESNKREAEMRGVLSALNLTSLVAEYDMNGNFIGINDAFLKLFGLQRAQILGKNLEQLGILDVNFVEYQSIWKDLKLGITKKSFEQHVRFTNGKEFWLSQSFTPILDDQGNPYKVLVVASDISDRKVQERELIDNAEELNKLNIEVSARDNENRSLMKAIDESMLESEFSPDGTYIRVNDQYLKTIYYNREDIFGKNLFDFLYGEEKKKFMKLWHNMMKGKPFKIIHERITKNGERVWISASYIPATDREGKIVKVYSIGFDITDYKRNEYDAISRIEELQRMLNEKSI